MTLTKIKKEVRIVDKKRILIIDNDRGIKKIIRKSLDLDDFEVEQVRSGEEGIKELKTSNYDLIILNTNLPEIEGVQLLKQIREEDYLMPILITTDFMSVEDAVKVVKLGAIDYLQKPYNIDDIKKQINKIIFSEKTNDDFKNHEETLIKAKSAIKNRELSYAENILRNACIINNTSPEAFNLLGIIEEYRGDSKQAMKMYRAALDIDPTYKPAQENLERSSDIKGKPGDVNFGE